MKKIISLFLVVISLFVCCAPAAEALGDDAQPLWIMISEADLDLVLEGTEGYVSGKVYGTSDTVEIVTTLKVYQRRALGLGWKEIKDFGTKTVTTTSSIHNGTFAAEEGKTYKAVFTYTVYEGLAGETDTSEVIRTNN